jgi:Uma2 family endonuclease
MSDAAIRAMSAEEYLRSEASSPYKREYVGGFVYPLHAQAGASESHVLICGNIAAALHASARQRGCRLYQSDMKLAIAASGSFYYPDVMLVCDAQDGERYFKTAPAVLVEVLSKSTAAHDRFGKYGMYTAIPSLQTYLIVEQDERRVYAYTRTDGRWTLQELIGTGEIHLPSLGRTLSLDEIYDGVLG